MIFKRTIIFAALCFLAILFGCQGNNTQPEVVVYTSVDDIFSRPVAKRFEEQSGIKVRLVTDTEETKSTGLLNRLIAESARPVADVFWSGDPVRAAILKKRGISAPYHSPSAKGLPEEFFDPEGYWTAFSTRARVIIFNKLAFSYRKPPASVRDLTSPEYKGMACMANPLFGTTSMHAAALFQALGPVGAKQFFNDFAANGGKIVGSNGDVKDKVASGECILGITDTDDINVAMKEGLDTGFVFPDQDTIGTLLVPNCAVLIKGAPHENEAKKFIDYLLSPEVEEMLAASTAAQFPLRDNIPGPEQFPPLSDIKIMQVDYNLLADTLQKIMDGFLKEWVDANS